jgi:prepilin-type N-terminal cleavage/methylation domain-containing protein
MRYPAFGFTQIELLIVIAMIGVLAAASIPVFVGFTSNQRLIEAANNVRADLRSAQNRAISGVTHNIGGGIKNNVWGIRFADPNAYSYTIFTCTSLDLTVSPCACLNYTNFTTQSLPTSFSFDISVNDRFIFDGTTGDICDQNGALTGSPNSVGITLSGSTKTITVSPGGQIE